MIAQYSFWHLKAGFVLQPQRFSLYHHSLLVGLKWWLRGNTFVLVYILFWFFLEKNLCGVSLNVHEFFFVFFFLHMCLNIKYTTVLLVVSEIQPFFCHATFSLLEHDYCILLKYNGISSKNICLMCPDAKHIMITHFSGKQSDRFWKFPQTCARQALQTLPPKEISVASMNGTVYLTLEMNAFNLTTATTKQGIRAQRRRQPICHLCPDSNILLYSIAPLAVMW